MAKPMLVSLPFVLLLIDYWPLERFKCFEPDHDNPQSSRPLNPDYHRSLALLVLEKVPFFVLATASSIVTFFVQQAGGAVKSLDVFPLQIRLANALVSYVSYVGKFIWPLNLAVFYPHPGMRPIWQVGVCIMLLLGVCAVVLRERYRHPYLATGWLWYLGTLVPVIGVVQVGAQSMADRYTYVPLIGLFIIIAWGVAHLVERWSWRKFVFAISAGVILSALTMCTCLQLRHWRNSITVFEHALDVTVDNNLAHYNLGQALAQKGRLDKAIVHYSEALRIEPDHPDAHNAHNNIGLALFRQGKVNEAIARYARALELKPDGANIHNNLGNALAGQARLDEAIVHYAEALRIKPDCFTACNDMGVALVRQGKLNAAIMFFSRALKIKSDCAEASHNLRLALSIADKPDDSRSTSIHRP
jgi:tetratricopeptide (TPR) repeat protein